MPVRKAFASAFLAALLLTPQAMAGDGTHPRGVVELFTSQGCNSCPPADAILSEMAQKGDVIALSYHVTYWDYLGWRDTLGNKDNTDRQYGYMRTMGSGSVYTPQMVINGRVHVNGSNRAAIDESLAETGSKSLPVGVNVSQTADTIVIETEASQKPVGKALMVLVYYEPPREIEVGRGENSGRKLTYWNAVTGVQTLGMWHGKGERYELPANEVAKKGGCAVLLQKVGKDGGPGEILGAAVVRKPTK